jgi:hypothetical protein
MSAAPYLSVVATGRNDDHGGDLLYRMQLFVNALVAQCERHALDAELVLVEWNPPADRPRLSEVLEWPPSDRCEIRVVEVPPELHAQLEHADRLPLFQMIAKNVGIRRAHADFVLATNVDVLLSDGVMEALAARTLEHGIVYRADRHDVTADIPLDAPVEEQLRLCEDSVIRIAGREGTLDTRTGDFYRVYPEHRLPWWATPLQHAYWFLRLRARRLLERGGNVPDAAAPHAIDGADASVPSRRTAHYRRRLHELWLDSQWERAGVRPHTNASGDFTLMSRDDWFHLRGYPELEVFSMHLDGLLLYLAHHAGMREKQLAGPVYHVEHEAGFRPDAASVDELSSRVQSAGIDAITDRQMVAWTVEMWRRGRPLEFNSSAWGFASSELPEQLPAPIHDATGRR